MGLNNHKGRIFISYGHDEFSEFAESLAGFLRENGYEVFIDIEGIHTGQEWENNLEDGLKWVKADGKDGIFILLMTPYSVRRPDGYCLNEMLYALDLGLKMVPIMLKTVTPPLSIYRIQYLDLTDTSEDKITSFSKILDCLLAPENDAADNPYRTTPLMRQLYPLDFTSEIELFSKDFVGRKWSISMIENWASSNHGVLAITGSPGVGKTALAVFLYNHLPDAIAFYMFRRNDSAKLPLKRFVQTIAYEISTQIKEYRESILSLDLEELVRTASPSRLFQKLIVSPLKKIKRPEEPKFILIDGLDEAESEAYNPVALFLDENIHFLPEWVNVIITTRPQVASVKPLNADTIYEMDPLSKDNLSDIDQYVEGVMPFLDDSQRALIIKQSQGSFLYVKHISEWYRNNCGEELPADIPSFYEIDFNKMFPTESDYASSRFFLELIIAASIPLSKRFLQMASKDSSFSVDAFLTTFESMIKEGKDSRIRIEHSSLVEWLESKQAGIYRINRRNGQERIIEILNSCLWVVKEGTETKTNIDFHKENVRILEDYIGLKYNEEFLFLYQQTLESAKDWTSFIKFCNWYFSSHSISDVEIRLINEIIDRNYAELSHAPQFAHIDDSFIERMKGIFDFMMQKACHGYMNQLTTPAYLILEQLRACFEVTSNNLRLTDLLGKMKNACPNMLSVFSSNAFHTEVDFGIADSISALFVDIRESDRITDSGIQQWLSIARVYQD